MITNLNTIIIGIVAGEVSGDVLGVGLIKSLKKHLQTVYFVGIGGDRMRSENMECWYDIADLSVMGVVEVIFKLPRFLKIRKNLINRFVKLKIDIFIGIDFPDFNIALEKQLKKIGIRTIHYVSPTIWAWRFNRIFDIKQATDIILVLFPFEKSIYDHFNIPCQCVGHTLADEIPLKPNKIAMRQKLGIAKDKKCLAILPGSRTKEIQMLSYNFIDCVKLLASKISNLEVLVPLHNQKLIDQFTKITLLTKIQLRIICTQRSWEIMIASDAALLTSGTVTLECMLSKCPMVVAYRMNTLTFMLIKNLVKTPWISLPNLLSGCYLVQEFIQKDCNPNNLTNALLAVFSYTDNQRAILQKKFHQLHKSIRLNASDRAAYVVLKHIQSK